MKLSKTQLYLLMQKNPTLALVEFMNEMEAKNEEALKALVDAKVEERLKDIAEGVRSIHDQEFINTATEAMLTNLDFKGPKGDNVKGDPGKTPIKGVDYFTSKDITDLVDRVYNQIVIPKPKDGFTPQAGVDYPNYDDIEKMVRLYVEKLPKYNESVVLFKLFEKVKQTYPKTEINPKDIISKINSLPLRPEFQIDASHIKNLPKAISKSQKSSPYARGGGGIANIASAIIATNSTIDDSNLVFSFASKPSILVINGGLYTETGGAITWTWSITLLQATLSVPVGTNGTIFGLK